ncbi:hypothetical protein [Francisella sp. 19X1-34]|uniref:hypothetical protein n=1 Tax=Francisella sp. 19X1-34 TaxID=3087177 RepID=UPI002E322839|nr:hypothetical protein [Francisella sp. 19X1-34]MED7788392.1 hypothetical protein [Francisella sp. 19X1-34]
MKKTLIIVLSLTIGLSSLAFAQPPKHSNASQRAQTLQDFKTTPQQYKSMNKSERKQFTSNMSKDDLKDFRNKHSKDNLPKKLNAQRYTNSNN